MKRTLAAIIIICFFQTVNAQLANTSWTGSVTAGGGTINVLWKLTADSSFFYNSDDNSLLDVSVFKVQDSLVTIKKVSGLSGCDGAEGVYTFNVTEKELKLYLVKDDCYDRSDALNKSVFVKQDN